MYNFIADQADKTRAQSVKKYISTKDEILPVRPTRWTQLTLDRPRATKERTSAADQATWDSHVDSQGSDNTGQGHQDRE